MYYYLGCVDTAVFCNGFIRGALLRTAPVCNYFFSLASWMSK